MKINQSDGIGTVVGANVRLQGILKDTNDISVYGVVDGEVISEKSVLVAETATVKGPVTADSVTISGNIKGSIEAKTKLEILASGKVTGSIVTATLIIHAGAEFNGKCGMTNDKGTAPEKSANLKDFFSPSNKEKLETQSSKADSESEIEIE